MITGYAIRDGVIVTSSGDIRTKPPFLDFLLKENGIKIFHNIKYDVAELAKLLKLDAKACKKLISGESVYVPPGYILQYVPGKVLAIKRRYPNDSFSSFANASYYLNDDTYIENPLEAARAAKDIGEEVYAGLEAIGLFPVSLTSPIRLFEKQVMEELNLPTVDDIPEEAGLFAYKCLRGGWVEAYQLGFFPQTWDYDVNSCYAYFTAMLPDTRNGIWIQSDRYEPHATLGYCYGIVIIDKDFSPIIERRGTRSFTPRGEWKTYLTKAQLEFIILNGIGDFIIQDGYWWLTNEKEIKFPLRDVVMEIYEAKEKSNGMAKTVAKRLLASIWGKFIERRYDEGLGRFFNPVWGVEVESRANLHVAEFVLDNKLEDNLLHISVDGVLTSKPAEIENSSDIGKWRLNTVSSAIVVSSGIAPTKGKELYETVTSLIASNPDSSTYRITDKRPLTLGRAVQEGRLNEIGTIVEYNKTLQIGAETKRIYVKRPRTGRDLIVNTYRGFPWEISALDVLKESQEEKLDNEDLPVVEWG